MKPHRSSSLVVGGGIAGLLATYILADAGREVTLLERGPELGGLLRSRLLPTGHFVDFGTHFMADTGIRELDDVLGRALPPVARHSLSPLRAGTFSFGRLNTDSPCLDIRGLGRSIEAQIVAEMLSSEDEARIPENLAEHVEDLFGTMARQNLFEPIFEKLCGAPCSQLAPNAMRMFSLERVVALTPEAARRLKTTPHGDRRFGFHSADERKNAAVAYYPTVGGIGRLTDGLAQLATAAGARMATGTFVTEILRQPDGRLSVTCSNGMTRTVDELVWSAPLPHLLRLLGERPTGLPQFRSALIEHFVFDKPYISGLHYFHSYDPGVSPFRVTLYDNVTSPTNGGHVCTVETLRVPTEHIDPSEHLDTTQQHLVQMGIIAPGASRIYAESHLEQAAFPVPTTSLQQQVAAQRLRVAQLLPECKLIGRATGRDFFMSDVLRETWQTMTSAVSKHDGAPTDARAPKRPSSDAA